MPRSEGDELHQAAGNTTVNQASQNLSLNWQTFNVGAHESVNFVQPNTAAIAVNRIDDMSASQILGSLNANQDAQWLSLIPPVFLRAFLA